MNWIPEGWHTVTPRIVVHDAERFVDFVKQAFGAIGEYPADSPAILHLGDSLIMISDAGIRSPSKAFLYVYVQNSDDVYRRAIAAGAHAIEPPLDTPYGDRRAMIEDKWGNTWQIATYRKPGSTP